MYSSAKAEFCAERSCSFCLETDFGLSLVLLLVVDDDDDSSEVIAVEGGESSDRSIPSMELDEEVEVAELARFIRNDLQSPSESSSM
mmetsp:Transcript_26463/g.45039  ORF Transcript_26463/g.45039 Transcript_26463/m.45039 type:complete len:87 (-) Transcript_26463:251-511(-)